MKNSLGIGQHIGYVLTRGAQIIARKLGYVAEPAIRISGQFDVTCVRPDGSTRWQKLFPNGVTNQGLDRILNTMFDGTTQIGAGAWELGLISSVSFTALAAADTHASHGGWTEAAATNVPDYDEAARPAWNPAVSSAQSSSNSTTVDFTINETGTVKGIFLSSVATKDSTSGGADDVLWATGLFPGGDQAVVSGDVLKITYTVNASAS